MPDKHKYIRQRQRNHYEISKWVKNQKPSFFEKLKNPKN